MPQTWAAKRLRAVLGIRWDKVPPEAKAACGAITEYSWSVVRRRLAGETCETIARAEGCSTQAVYNCCQRAIEALVRRGGRAVSINDVRRAAREDRKQPVLTCEEVQLPRGVRRCRPADQVEAKAEALADAFLAGKVSAAQADRQGRALESELLALDGAD